MQFLTRDTARSARSGASGHDQSEEAWKGHLEEVWTTVLGEAWKEIAAQLASPSSQDQGINDAERQAESGNAYAASISDIARDHMSRLTRSQSHFQDYADGALMAFNPMPHNWRTYTCSSDMAALFADWSAVRNDMVEGWAALTIEKPAMRELLELTVCGWKDVRRAGSK